MLLLHWTSVALDYNREFPAVHSKFADCHAFRGCRSRLASLQICHAFGEAAELQFFTAIIFILILGAVDPRENGHVGNGVAAIDEEITPFQPCLQHSQQPLHLRRVPLHWVWVLAFLLGVLEEMAELMHIIPRIWEVHLVSHSSVRKLISALCKVSSLRRPERHLLVNQLVALTSLGYDA